MQHKRHSLFEAIASTVVGFFVTLIVQSFTFPYFGIHVSMATNLTIVGIMTIVSVLRGYLLRRLFNWHSVWHSTKLRDAWLPAQTGDNVLVTKEDFEAQHLQKWNSDEETATHVVCNSVLVIMAVHDYAKWPRYWCPVCQCNTPLQEVYMKPALASTTTTAKEKNN